jgi:hypothetical protein
VNPIHKFFSAPKECYNDPDLLTKVTHKEADKKSSYMTTVGGQLTREKRNLVTYVEKKHYELLRGLAERHHRSVSAEAAAAVYKHIEEHLEELEPVSPEK